MLRASRLPTPTQDGREHYRVEMPSDLSRVDDLIDVVVGCCFGQGEPSCRTRFRLCTVVAEAVVNAVENGNRNDPARRVTVEIEVHADHVIIGVTDEGDGYDTTTPPDPTTEDALERTSGRGLFMIRELADHVAFNDRGNTIWMTLPRC